MHVHDRLYPRSGKRKREDGARLTFKHGWLVSRPFYIERYARREIDNLFKRKPKRVTLPSNPNSTVDGANRKRREDSCPERGEREDGIRARGREKINRRRFHNRAYDAQRPLNRWSLNVRSERRSISGGGTARR